MKSLHDAVMNSTNQAYIVELDEEERDLSVSPNGKFLGIVRRGKSYLRSIKTTELDDYDSINLKSERFSDWQIPEPSVNKLIFSEDNKRFVAVTDNAAIVRDTETLGNAISFPLSTELNNISLNNDGTQLVLKDKIGAEICKPESNCALSPNEEWMAMVDDSDGIQIVNLTTKKLLGVPKKL